LEFNWKRITIEGYTSFDIQGINLREKIEGFVKAEGKSLDIFGNVHNLKDGRVQVICTGKDTKLLHDQLEKWKEEKKYNFKKIEIIEFYDPKAESFTDFTVERADDLSEMVLALRGAGCRFVQSTETLEKINQNILDRDSKLMKGKLLTLHYELTNIISEFDEPNPNRNKIYLEAMKTNVSSPVIPEENFAHLLMQVFIELQEFQIAGITDRIDHLKVSLNSLRKMVDDELADKHKIRI
jgi:acylphosphatase